VPTANAAVVCSEGNELPASRQPFGSVVWSGRSRPAAYLSASAVTELSQRPRASCRPRCWRRSYWRTRTPAMFPPQMRRPESHPGYCLVSEPITPAGPAGASCVRTRPSYSWATAIAATEPPKNSQSLLSQRDRRREVHPGVAQQVPEVKNHLRGLRLGRPPQYRNAPEQRRCHPLRLLHASPGPVKASIDWLYRVK